MGKSGNPLNSKYPEIQQQNDPYSAIANNEAKILGKIVVSVGQSI